MLFSRQLRLSAGELFVHHPAASSPHVVLEHLWLENPTFHVATFWLFVLETELVRKEHLKTFVKEDESFWERHFER